MTGAVPRSPEAGVTLVEMLVALAVSAFVGIAGFATLDTILRVNGATEGRLAQLELIDRTLMLLRGDLAMASPETLVLDADSLGFQRRIEGEPVQLSYELSTSDLTRRFGEEGVAQALMPDLHTVSFRVLDTEGGWHSNWPVTGGTAEPRAVELVLTLESAAQDRTVRGLFPVLASP